MRERHLFWDIAALGLLLILVILGLFVVIENERGWGVMQKILDNQKELTEQNRALLNKLNQGLVVSGHASPPAHQNNSSRSPLENGQASPPRTGIYANLPPHVPIPTLPEVVRGDENADDGDWLVMALGSEPNSLNPIIDNDSTVSTLFSRANDNLATRWYDDISLWQPGLALAWTKELICYARTKPSVQAKDLAQAILTKWDPSLRDKLQIKNVVAEEDGVVRIEIGDVNNDYAEHLRKDFAEMIDPQWWFFVNYQGVEFLDGTEITKKRLAEYVSKPIREAPEFKGRLLEPWVREDSVVLVVLGDEKARDAAESVIQGLAKSDKNVSYVLDKSEASGKRKETLLAYDMMEDYIAQEKPVFTFYLRKDVRWHDDRPFSGKDVVFSYKAILDPKIDSGHIRNYFQDCESCELVEGDSSVVRFVWKKPYFASFDFSAGIDIIPEHIYRYDRPEEFNTNPRNQELIGTGAYKLERWDKTQQIVFVRNESYYGRKPHFDQIVYKVVKDPTVRLKLLESGDIDYLNMPPSQMAAKQDDPEFAEKFRTFQYQANVYRYLGWNARIPCFSDKNVRRALTMLTDRERICTDIYRGYAKPHHTTVHPQAPGYLKDLEKYVVPFDPEGAKKLLDRAGWADSDGDGVRDKDGVPFKFTLLIVSNSAEYESIANLVKDSFGRAGIVVNVSNLEWSAFLQKIERLQFDACLLGWALGLVGDPYQLWHSTQDGEKESNHCAFRNKKADRLIERFRRELNDEKRNTMLEEFQRIVIDEQPYTFLFVPDSLGAYDKRIRNVTFKLIGADNDRWWVPKAEQKHR